MSHQIHYDRYGKDGVLSHKEVSVLFVPDLSDCLPSLNVWKEQWLAHKKAVVERERQIALKKEVCAFIVLSRVFINIKTYYYFSDFYLKKLWLVPVNEKHILNASLCVQCNFDWIIYWRMGWLR